MSCGQNLHRIADAGTGSALSGRACGGRIRSRRHRGWHCGRWMPDPAGEPLRTVAFSPATRLLRRNALSPLGVRIGGAPGAPLFTGCSSANRALAGELLRSGIVAVPKVFDTGCFVLSLAGEGDQPRASARPGGMGEWYSRPGALRPMSQACGHRATHGGTQGVAGIVDIRRLSEQRESTLAQWGPLYQVDGPSRFS
jgi:hypothetical protein